MDICTDENVASPVLVAKKLKHEDASASNIGTSGISCLMDGTEHLKCSTSGSSNSTNINGTNSDLSYHNDNDICDGGDDYADDVSEYYDNVELMYEDEGDDYLAIQSQFDNVDLLPGVEASISWLKDLAPHGNVTSAASTSNNPDILKTKGKASALDHAETSGKAATCYLSEKMTHVGMSSSPVLGESCSKVDEATQEKIVSERFTNFKQFDVVEDFSDHHYSRMGFSGQQPPKNWAKKIQDEWKILEKDLPDTISVRVYESRMELLRAVIIGPSGTPYHDGLFVFDCLFPPTYPNEPPMVYYYSGGLRLNPNLYDCGKVCLSLLGTWSGDENEMWVPSRSTMLQVLVSIQALILNAEPYYNEPGYLKGPGTYKASDQYSEDAFIMSLKTMMYTLRRPPKHFDDFVMGHFRDRAHDILVACKAYADGAKVGSFVVNNGVAEVGKASKSASPQFRATVRQMINVLVKNFTQFGSIECEQFRVSD